MSTISDFISIDDCDKIDPRWIDAYVDFNYDPDNPTGICLHTSWGGNCLDLTEIVKTAESCTTLYLSPEDDPNCLVYEPEEKCGDNICIHGDDLSKIISMRYLKDVSGDALVDGAVYMYNETTNMFEPFDLKTALSGLGTNIENLTANLSNLINRIVALENKLTPPADAPEGVKVVFGNINEYSDPNVVIDGSTGAVTTLDKTHGFYTHTLANNAYGDEIFG